MNLTNIGNIPSSNWKRVTTHSISAVAGMALAIGAVVAFGSSTSGPTSVAPSREASVLAVTRDATYESIQDYAGREQALLDRLSSPSATLRLPAELPEAPNETVRYLVATEQEAADLAASVTQDLSPAYVNAFSFAVVSSSEDEAREVAAIARAGTTTRLVDMRQSN